MQRMFISECRGVWLFAMFDLPLVEKVERARATRFRNTLLQDGFTMTQYSICTRYYPSEEAGEVHRRSIKKALPPAGHVSVLTVTDKQFGKMQICRGKKRQPAEEPPDQIMLF